MLNKKAAMFGLDARIALAIFGALSVITGAALYSAIQNAKATAVLTAMSEVVKAWESYYIDTGSMLSVLDESNTASYKFYRFKIKDLVVDPGISGWRGPYISAKVLLDDSIIVSTLGTTKVSMASDKVWDNVNGLWSPGGYCLSGEVCYIVVDIGDSKVFSVLDKKLDGGDGFSKGRVRRYVNPGDKTITSLYIMFDVIKNPND